MYNKKTLAAELNGRQYREEMTQEEEKLAKQYGLVVVFGYSDDNIEFKGAIDDEIGAYTESFVEIKFDKEGVLPTFDDMDEDEAEKYFERKKNFKTLKAYWGKENYSWIIETKIPHSTFDILEDEEKYCRGIVFDIDDLK